MRDIGKMIGCSFSGPGSSLRQPEGMPMGESVVRRRTIIASAAALAGAAILPPPAHAQARALKIVVIGDHATGKTALIIAATLNAAPKGFPIPELWDMARYNLTVDGRAVETVF